MTTRKITVFGFGADEERFSTEYDGVRAHQDMMKYTLYLCILMCVFMAPALAYFAVSGSDGAEVLIFTVVTVGCFSLIGGIAIPRIVNTKWRRAIANASKI